MQDVEFSEEKSFDASVNKLASREKEKWTPARLAVRLGLAKDETGVNIILITVALVVVLLTVILFIAAK